LNRVSRIFADAASAAIPTPAAGLKIIFSRDWTGHQEGWFWLPKEVTSTSDEWRAGEYEADEDGGTAVTKFTGPRAGPRSCYAERLVPRDAARVGSPVRGYVSIPRSLRGSAHVATSPREEGCQAASNPKEIPWSGDAEAELPATLTR